MYLFYVFVGVTYLLQCPSAGASRVIRTCSTNLNMRLSVGLVCMDESMTSSSSGVRECSPMLHLVSVDPSLVRLEEKRGPSASGSGCGVNRF